MKWVKQQQNAITSIETLSKKFPKYNIAKQTNFNLKITPYYLSLIDKDNPNDKLAKIVIPSSKELNIKPEELDDPIGDKTKNEDNKQDINTDDFTTIEEVKSNENKQNETKQEENKSQQTETTKQEENKSQQTETTKQEENKSQQTETTKQEESKSQQTETTKQQKSKTTQTDDTKKSSNNSTVATSNQPINLNKYDKDTIDTTNFQEIESNDKKASTSTVDTKMPQTGENDTIKIAGIVVFSIIGLISFYKYKESCKSGMMN